MTALRVILASQSPRRRELLNLVGVVHEVQPADIDESYLGGERPREHAERLARGKTAVIAEREPDALVIGSDTIVVVDGDVLGKPADEAEARRMLRRLAGRSHVVMTAVAVVWRGETRSGVEQVGVEFHPLTDAEIDAYVATREPMDKAGAYGIQGYGATIVERIDGDYFSVMGLSLGRLIRLLARDHRRLLACEPLGVIAWLLAGEVRLIDVGGPHLVRDAHQGQELASPGRLRGEDDARSAHRSSQRVTGPSFTRSTSIIAPNSPVSTWPARSRSIETKRS